MHSQLARTPLRLSAAAAISRSTQRTTTTSIQTRACSQCRSAKEWKENHGAWSRTPLSRPSTTTSSLGVAGSQQQFQQKVQLRAYASEGKSVADETIEEITELFNTAKDEFELAYEETEKNTVYAADDRAAAEEEYAKMKAAYDGALKSLPQEISAEVQRRIGQRIRELDEGMKRLNAMAMED